ncbi:hypothetical protein RESH_00932 [Rhodopirellula europaea SH398]|uniref:Uncharacterized protein n=1 Tax=Rhodopirellula europaea SH398 TaxID=1263868 RepID=M5SL35_9BACT|nr:hypothetical protein RESH_00932 [Rhodopirellula europaea SH398]
MVRSSIAIVTRHYQSANGNQMQHSPRATNHLVERAVNWVLPIQPFMPTPLLRQAFLSAR